MLYLAHKNHARIKTLLTEKKKIGCLAIKQFMHIKFHNLKRVLIGEN
jgi:hypothetical protein